MPPPRADVRSRVVRAAPCLLLFALSMAMCAIHSTQYHVLSPIDEVRHVDYAMRLTEGELPNLGDRLGQEAMREEACRGVDIPTHRDPPCDREHFNPLAFRDEGYQTASAHPPTYYMAVGLVARALTGVGLFHDFTDPARLMGGVLLGLGLVFAYFAGVRLGIRKGALLAALAMVVPASAVMHSTATVNPDSASVLAGGLVLLAAVRWEQGELSMRWLVGAGALATGIKFTNLLIVVVVAGWLLARSPQADRFYDRVADGWGRLRGRIGADPPGPETEAAGRATASSTTAVASKTEATTATAPRRTMLVRAALALTAGAVAAAAVWAFIDRLRATVDPSVIPQNQALKAHGFPAIGQILSTKSGLMLPNVFTWFPPVDGYDPTYFTNSAVRNGRLFVFFLFAAAMLVACLRCIRRDRVLVLGTVGTVVAIVGAPAFLLLNYFIANVISEPTGRYGMALLPVFVVVLAAWVRTRAATVALVLVAATIYLVQFFTILSADVPKAVVG